MTTPESPKRYDQVKEGERIAFLEAITSPITKGNDLQAPLTADEVAVMRKIVIADYQQWLSALGLKAVPVDVYGYNKTSEEKTEFNTHVKNGVPGYNGNIIIFPLMPSITREDGMEAPVFPPSSWDGKLPAWPTWRVDLLHEVVHLVEEQILGLRSGKEDLKTYSQAIDTAAELLSGKKAVTSEQLQMLTNGFKERTLT